MKYAIIILSLLAAVIVPVLLIYFPEWIEVHQTLKPWIDPDGLGSGVTVEFIGGLLFLAIGLALNLTTEKRIDEMHANISKQFEEERIERKYERFKHIFENEGQYDIWIDPDNSDSLFYSVHPISENGKRVIVEHLGRELLVVRVDLPRHFEFKKEERANRYAASPIRDGEHYFCSFINRDWQLSQDGFDNWFKFILVGKVDFAWGRPNANSYGRTQEDDAEHLLELRIPDQCFHDNSIPRNWSLNRRKDGSFVIKLSNDIPLKQIYFVDRPNTFGDSIPQFLVIENMRGYDLNLPEAVNFIFDEVHKKGIEIDRRKHYQVDLTKVFEQIPDKDPELN